MICNNDNVTMSIDLWTKPNNMLFCFVQLNFNGYSKKAFDLKIAFDNCH